MYLKNNFLFLKFYLNLNIYLWVPNLLIITHLNVTFSIRIVAISWKRILTSNSVFNNYKISYLPVITTSVQCCIYVVDQRSGISVANFYER